MESSVPLVGSVSTGFGNNLAMTAPTTKTPNLEEAAESFVAMLYSYMFQQMRESGSDEENGLFSGPHVNMLMGFLDEEVGKKIAQDDGRGLAAQMLEQLGASPKSDKSSAEPSQDVKNEALQQLTQAGNTLKDMTQQSPDVVLKEEDSIMDQIYRLNRPNEI